MYDVVIVSGGPAGLSAALVLGRCRRRVHICDNGYLRNTTSRAIAAFLSHDGVTPLELLRVGRGELQLYGIDWCHATVTDSSPHTERFLVHLDPGDMHHCRYCDA